MDKPTVAHVKDHFLPKSETFIYTLITSLKQYHAIVLDRYQAQNAAAFPFSEHFSPASQFGSWGSYAERGALRTFKVSPYLERVIKQQNTSLIHAHFGQLGALFLPVARRHHLPLITSFYGKDISVFTQDPQWESKFADLWEYGALFCVLGQNMAADLEKTGCPENKIVILPLSIDMNKFAFTPHTKPAADKITELLTVGRLIPKKGIDVLLKALASCPESIHLIVAGDGPERQNLELLANKLNLANRVSFAGWVTNEGVSQLMEEVDAFVLASRTDPDTGEAEGTPTVLLEAQAKGLPVITTIHADIPTIMNNKAKKFLVPENDSDLLAAAIQELCTLSAENWLELGHAGRRFVANTHDRDVVGLQLESIYDSLLGA